MENMNPYFYTHIPRDHCSAGRALTASQSQGREAACYTAG